METVRVARDHSKPMKVTEVLKGTSLSFSQGMPNLSDTLSMSVNEYAHEAAQQEYAFAMLNIVMTHHARASGHSGLKKEIAFAQLFLTRLVYLGFGLIPHVQDDGCIPHPLLPANSFKHPEIPQGCAAHPVVGDAMQVDDTTYLDAFLTPITECSIHC